ncbi:XdhC family protein [Streptomyces triticagri]|uniref:XdhC family protein n=1 Tax=Streptomyces triticagri TaxID=2293568 RepID=A0A372LX42_9ACTN|nr:XdhC family protein [Streptomyces triticagri]RFU82597.1 XdhC family protein [Streptomyces triticagri]
MTAVTGTPHTVDTHARTVDTHPRTVDTHARELAAQRVPFVHARVVRAQAPSSAHPGDEAIVYGDGRIEGFVGGVCAEESVRTAALGALRGDGPLLLRVLPEGDEDFPDTPGAQVVVNPCLSGGALEIFLEPVLPPPLIEIAGRTPIAEACVALADVLGYATARSLPEGPPAEHTGAVVVAGHGRGDTESLRAALDAGVPHIELVASRRRGAALLDELGLTEAERVRIHSPAGLDIGARTPAEIALSILAEIVESVRSVGAPSSVGHDDRPVQAVDPVCGMTVTVRPDTSHLAVGEEELWFCGPGCRDRYAAGLAS